MSANGDLIPYINRRVVVRLDYPDRRERGVLLRIGPSGCRVRFDDGRERVVAGWRVLGES